MKEFLPYLEAIGIESRVFQERVEFAYNVSCKMCPEKLEDVFVTNYVKNDGTTEYQNLWFFSAGYCLEAKEFLTKFDFDITPIKEAITYWTVTSNDYNFEKATVKSTLSLRFSLLQGIEGDFKAQGINCDYLWNIINKYVKPNLVR